MANSGTAPPERSMPYVSALAEVVKGLRHDPVLLYGIGAGILVVGVLVFTADRVIVLIVAALLVIVLFVRVHRDAQRLRGRGSVVDVGVFGSTLDKSNVANVDQAAGDATVRARIGFSRMKGSNVGNVGSVGPVDRKKKPEA